MKEYTFKNIRKNEDVSVDDNQTGRIPRIQLELVIPPSNEEVTIWFPKDNKKTSMVRESFIIYVFDDDLVKEIDKEIAKQLEPVEIRRVKPNYRRSGRLI